MDGIYELRAIDIAQTSVNFPFETEIFEKPI